MLWMHSENEGRRGELAPRGLSGHGLAYWTDGKEERILYITPGYRLIALNAKTGFPIPTFGTNGVVDLRQNDDQEMDLVTADIGLHATPVVSKNVVIVGAAFGAYEARMIAYMLPHGPIELAAYSCAITVYRSARAGRLQARSAWTLTAATVLLLAVAAVLEAIASPI